MCVRVSEFVVCTGWYLFGFIASNVSCVVVVVVEFETNRKSFGILVVCVSVLCVCKFAICIKIAKLAMCK